MKKKHYTMQWDILKAVDVVEEYERTGGKGQLPYAWLRKIYTGNLLDAVHFSKIPKRNTYGVAFKTLIQDVSGQHAWVDTSFRLDTPTSLTELINGMSDCKVKDKTGFTTRGWKGAKDEWLKIMDEDYPNYDCIQDYVVVNCLV